MLRKVLVANRGEIAVRVARACRELGIPTVAVYSTADAGSRHVRLCDESVCIGPPASGRSYRNAAAIIEAARKAGADAIHPGYGFLSEDPDFAEICLEAGLTFIGPPPDALHLLGDKETARAWMAKSGAALLSGTGPAPSGPAEAREVADGLGYPVIIKAAAGGGGRGMTVVREPGEFAQAYAQTRATAAVLYGDDRLYVERYLDGARHVEVQFLCDQAGSGIHLGTRDCTVQRRHQKLVEEAPAPALSSQTLDEMCAVTLHGVLAAGYVGAGTAEFLVDAAEQAYFLEVNCRIQVEHPVSEMISGIDLVAEQVQLAAGGRLRHRQEDVILRGHALECRVNAEDPARNFAPTPGVLTEFLPPGGPFTRVDSHGEPGYRIPPDYDSLVAKVAVWAPDREQAIARAERALAEFAIAGPGVKTTIPFLAAVLADTDFRKVRHTTGIADHIGAGFTGGPTARSDEERRAR
jgi:acetyl-CoA carboxylase, biotin carboxylase subunit